MKLNDLDGMSFDTARPLPVCRSEHGWNQSIAALKARLARAWVGLYAPPPRRLPPLV